MNGSRKDFNAQALLAAVFNDFKKALPVQVKGNRKDPITLNDCLMSGLAMFGLKCNSLLQFDSLHLSDEIVRDNLKALYRINNPPCDTYMRERLDEVDPEILRKPFKTLLAKLQRGKALEPYQYIDGHYLIAGDGTGFFSSTSVHCANCCEKQSRDGVKTYFHQMYGASIVHPKIKTVIPLVPEPILRNDGATKNDCELNASQRFVTNFRREHPHLKVIMLGDSLLSRGPYIRKLLELRMHYILVAKESDHKFLFEFVNGITKYYEEHTKDGFIHQYRYVNGVPLNDANRDLEVNFLDYTEIDNKGKKQRFSWVTDIKLNEQNLHQVMQGGRTRWKIENETFNTLKNQGYQFEHNFGHGNKNLSTVFSRLLVLAFLIDQIQELCDSYFQRALVKEQKKSYLWKRIQIIFFAYCVNTWESLWNAIIHGYRRATIVPNST